MPRYKLVVEYDGGRFYGWQRQNGYISVQQAIEDALKAMTEEDTILVEGAGRTDAGVHAMGQVAHVDLKKDYPSYRLQDGINHFVRDLGVTVLNVEKVPMRFHARFSAMARTYHYRIVNRRAPLALDSSRAWHVIAPLDVELMQAGANYLLGTHDFNSFRSVHCQAENSVRTLDVFSFNQEGPLVTARIQSRAFLHNQVRVMIGTLKQVGAGERPLDDILHILNATDRRSAGPTAPPQGLYLTEVKYDREVCIEEKSNSEQMTEK